MRRAERRAALAILSGVALGVSPARAQTASPQPTSAQTVPLITTVAGRRTTTLDGRWGTIVDPYETGYYTYRRRPDPNGFFRNRKPADAAELVEYDFDHSPQLAVPGDWNTQREDLRWYEGTVWYKTSFTRTLAPGRRLFVHFGAANYEARAWLNGTELGAHEGGFTPFDFEVTRLVRPGPNDLVVKVDNRRRADAVPTVNSDWWNYGGLTRSVTLVETPATFVRDYALQLDPAHPDRATGWVQLDGPAAASAPVTVRLPADGLTQTVRPDSTGRAALSLDASHLARWSPARPTRHDVEITTAADTVRDRVGFRTLAVRGTQILLNGRPVFLRGVAMHEEAPYDARRATNADDARALLGWVRDLGGNFVRLAHYPHNEATVRTADSLGILVWAELPVYWTIDWENPATLASAERQLEEIVARDRNRAAVAFWSVANETPRDPNPEAGPRLRFLTTLAARARALDPTRLVTAALEHRYTDPHTIAIDDPLGRTLDVLGNNEYLGWYDGPVAKSDSVRWTSAFDKPLVMSEFGGDARQGLHGAAGARWTEEYQADLYAHQVAMFDRIPFLAGTSAWILKDFRSPRRPLPGIQDYFNRKGLVSDRGERKAAFDVLRGWYERKRAAVPDP